MREAHLLEIRKLQLTVKNMVHKAVDLCPKCSKTHQLAYLIPKIFQGIILPTPPPVKGKKREGKGCVVAVVEWTFRENLFEI